MPQVTKGTGECDMMMAQIRVMLVNYVANPKLTVVRKAEEKVWTAEVHDGERFVASGKAESLSASLLSLVHVLSRLGMQL
jgi:hypothetical protein